MAEAKFAEKLLRETGRDEDAPEDRGRSKQRQVGAFSLAVKHKDGRSGEGFSWADYRGHRWTNDGEKECVKVIFGLRLLIVDGYELDETVHDIENGQLKTIRELTSREVMLLRNHNPQKEPIIESIRIEPSFEEIVKEIRGENERDTGFAGKVAR